MTEEELMARNDYETRQKYEQKCDNCDHALTVRTQQDNYPEYYTDVYIQCSCDHWVKFTLPVN